MKSLTVNKLLLLLIASISFGQVLTDTLRIRFDFQRNLVYYEKWRDSCFLGVVAVESLSSYFFKTFKENFLSSFSSFMEKEQRVRQFEKTGLMPVIEIPKIPFLGGTEIKISGEDRITFGGRQTIYSSPLALPRGNLLPELQMNQELRLNVSGEIGGKTKINIDHDSKRMEDKNKISIVYTGTEDEIIKKVEGGDIALGFPQTRYTGDIPSHKGLFGLRSEGNFGPIAFYSVFSRERSEGKTIDFKGKAKIKVDTFYDYDYARYKFFILDTSFEILKKISDFQLFYDDGNPYNDIQTNAIRCLATIYPLNPDSIPENSDERVKAGFVPLIKNKDYYLRTLTILPYGEIMVVELNIDVTNGNLACYYVTTDGESCGGKRYQDSLLLLKLLKKKRFDKNSPTFKYALRNIYSLSEKNLKIRSLKILRTTKNYVTEYEDEGEYQGKSFLYILGLDPDNDGEVNYPYFQPAYGLIVFPELFPFASERLSEKDEIIYYKEPLSFGEGGKYMIVGEYLSSIQEFFLGTTDIMENTEKVYINGREAERGKDYTIDYREGKITFFNLPPDAEVKVSFQQLPLFAPTAKSFVGFRAESKLLEDLGIGTSFLMRSEGAYSDKPEYGTEPFSKGIFSFNLDYKKDFDFFFKEKARFLINGEMANSFENSNTLNNAYIDDFEGTTLESPLDIRGSFFFFAPVPYFSDTSNLLKKMPKIKNPKDKDYVFKSEIFGPQIGEEGREKDNYLILEFSDFGKNKWFGIVQALQRGSFLDLENYENLEMIFKIDEGSPSGVINFHLASYLEEDVPRIDKYGKIVGYNNLFDTEDKNGNNELEPDEDRGLDTVWGADSLNIKDDDGNDDYDLYENPMGTEGNRILNSEDIDLNGFNERGDNHYFVYSVSLNESGKVKDLYNNWKIVTIPLKRPDTIIGRPSLSEIRKLAIYFRDFSSPFKMRIYSIKFTGVRWRKPRFLRKDIDTLLSKASVYSVNNKNTPNYTSPFKVKKDIRGMYYEASLGLTVDSFFPYDTVITEMFLSSSYDLRKYSQISFYVHKEEKFEGKDIMIYFRLGVDSSNFYFVSFPLEEKEGFLKIRKVPYGENWYEITLLLDSLPIFKEKNELFRGQVSLNNIRYFALGAINIFPSKVSYTLWFNDLKLNKPKNEGGIIYGLNTSFSLLNTGFNTSFNLEKKNPFFSRLTESPRVATDEATSYALNSQIDLGKLLPSFLNISLPLSYSKNGSFLKPYYSPTIPDLKAKEHYREKDGSEQYSFAFRRNKASNNFFWKYSLDAFSYSFYKRFGFLKKTLNIDTSITTNQNFAYNISPDFKIKIKENDISLLPKNISLSLTLSDNLSKRKNRAKESDTFNLPQITKNKNASLTSAFSYSPINNLDISYSQGSYFNRLGYYQKGIKEKRSFLGLEEGFSRDFSLDYNLSLWDILEPSFSLDGSYDESKAKIKGDTYTNERTINNDFSYSLSFDFDLPELFSKMKLEKWENLLEAVNIDYNFSRNIEYPKIPFRPALFYQLGLKENLPYDSSQRAKDYEYSFNLSSGFLIKPFSLKWRYENNWERNIYGLASRQGSKTIKFPSLDITITNVEKLLPKIIASSQITSRIEKTKTISSPLTPDLKFISQEKREDNSYSFSPLISWQLNFKNQMNTQFNLNYSKNISYDAFSNTSNYSEDKGFSFSYAYNFSLKEGIKLLFLKRIRLTQNIGFTSNFAYNLRENYSLKEQQKTILGKTSNYSLSLSFSYNLSAYTQMGLNTAYSAFKNLLKRDKTQSIDVNMWVLFRF